MPPSPSPLGLYVHLPWRLRKCPYCDFNSYELRGTAPEHDYVAALLRDLESELAPVADRQLASIFIGGGTPSLFSGPAIAALLDGIRARIATDTELEITLEANPGAAEAERFRAYREAGVSRLSIGVQSLRDEQLRRLGRVHAADEAIAAVTAAQAAGFANINMDLMYGLPGDSVAGAMDDLTRAIALAPTHLSWYQLTLEPNTAFERHPPALPDDDIVLAIETAGRALLAAAGFGRYEVSAYAQPGFRCRHNLNYWEFGDYLGIGAGAHGKLTLADGSIERRAKTRNPRSWMATAGTQAAVSVERIDEPEALTMEFLMNALRLIDGVPSELLTARTRQPLARIEAGLANVRQRGWLEADPAQLRATPAGLQALNRMLAQL
jgi:oxygen-independent coproporphyrinogen-3 oxidase